jgi:hypothetical protein
VSADTSITANVSGGEVGVVAQQVHIEHQYVGVPAPSARGPADLGIARIFQSRTRVFTDEYLVSETGPVPFGGRDAELRRLDEWLSDPQSPPRMLVTAPAGRGKSALLVRWMKDLQDGGVCGVDGWQLAFMPISIRTGTNRPEVFYEGLARRLAEITREPLPTEAFRDGDGFRYAVRDQFDRLASAGKPPILVVIDGVDEALEGSFDAGVLPTPMPKNVRVLLSARWQLGDHNSRGWLERLRWDRGAKVEAFELERLDTTRIADIFVKLGAPVDVLTQDPGLVGRLAQLTEGEPILVRYYAEDLWSAGNKGARVTRGDLELLKPGFDSYFKRWFELQEKLWKEEGGAVDRREVDAVLSVLAFALGPLAETDLLVLMERIHGLIGVTAVARLMEPLRRWVFGSGKGDAGYVLTHPKIGDYLQRSSFAAVATRLRQGFADWGKAHCIALNEGLITPEQASPYCLQFLPEHLRQAKASPEDFMVMVENGWRCAWEHFEGGQRGFVSAVQAARAALLGDNPSLRIGPRWRCALTLSSINSIGQNIPPELALAAVEKGILTIRQATYFADLKGGSKERVQLLAGLALAARDNLSLSKELTYLALEDTLRLSSETVRRERLITTLQVLCPLNAGLGLELRQEVLNTALAVAKAFSQESERSAALAALIPHLRPEQKDEAVREALAAARAITDQGSRSIALAAVAPYLTIEQSREILSEALAILKTDLRYGRSKVLAALAHRLEPDQRDQALAVAGKLDDAATRSKTLAALAAHLAPDQADEALRDALAAANSLEEYARSDALATLADLAPTRLGDLVAAAEAIGEKQYRLRALSALASHLATQQLDELLSETSDDEAIGIRDDVLKALAPHIAPERLSAVIAAVEAQAGGRRRSEVLAALAPRLAPAQLSKALSVAQTVGDNYARTEALVALVPYLPPEKWGHALRDEFEAMKAAGRGHSRSLAALVPHLTPEQIAEALAVTNAVDTLDGRIDALKTLAPHLSPEQLHEALAATKTITDARRRLPALVAFAPRLPPEQLAEAVSIAKTEGNDYLRSDALAALAPQLAPQQFGEAIAAATDINNEVLRITALTALVPRLPPEQKDDVLREALLALTSKDKEGDRLAILAVLAPHLAAKQLREAVGATKLVLDDQVSFPSPLAAVAAYLTPEELDGAFAAAKAMKTYAGSQHLGALAPYLRPEQLREAVAAIKATQDDQGDFFSSKAMAALVSHFPNNQLDEAITTAIAINLEDERVNALAALAHRIPGTLKVLLALIEAAGDASRERALSGAQASARSTFELGGQGAVLELFRAIQDVFRWFP